MKSNSPDQSQANIFKPILKQIINPKDPLAILADLFPWKALEKSLEQYYSHTGSPAKPIRLMASLLIIKQLYNLGDEPVVKAWVHNPYFQYFSGEVEFQWKQPIDPSDLVHFRNRIGKQGVEEIFALSVRMQGKDADSLEIVVDSTAQEKDITYPTDTKLAIKVIKKCQRIAKKEGIDLRQSYTRTTKKLLLMQRFAHHPKNKKKAAAAKRKLKTIAGRLVRELNRKLAADALVSHSGILALCERVLRQKQSDKNKIYSLHEPEVACIAKGKVAKKFEFGSKVSVAITKNTNVVVGIVNFTGNPHDSKTLEDTLEQVKRTLGKSPKGVIADRGYRGKVQVGETQIIIPKPLGKQATPYQKVKTRTRFRRRAAIEPVISHLKSDFRMVRNFLKGVSGDQINAVMAGAAFNFKRLIRKIEEQILWLVFNQSFEDQKLRVSLIFTHKSSW
jgi:transposase, IS5 family